VWQKARWEKGCQTHTKMAPRYFEWVGNGLKLAGIEIRHDEEVRWERNPSPASWQAGAVH